MRPAVLELLKTEEVEDLLSPNPAVVRRLQPFSDALTWASLADRARLDSQESREMHRERNRYRACDEERRCVAARRSRAFGDLANDPLG